ncbi:hypothetical protein Taro_011118, partial [Colocasia esculenta]|nr:hypothetical protein [Colocasia esculenta]
MLRIAQLPVHVDERRRDVSILVVAKDDGLLVQAAGKRGGSQRSAPPAAGRGRRGGRGRRRGRPRRLMRASRHGSGLGEVTVMTGGGDAGGGAATAAAVRGL